MENIKFDFKLSKEYYDNEIKQGKVNSYHKYTKKKIYQEKNQQLPSR